MGTQHLIDPVRGFLFALNRTGRAHFYTFSAAIANRFIDPQRDQIGADSSGTFLIDDMRFDFFSEVFDGRHHRIGGG